MKTKTIRKCLKCETRTPHNRMENREDSPLICLMCGNNSNKKEGLKE